MFDLTSVPAFLARQTGVSRDDGLMIYAPEDVAERNQTYEVAEYLPGHLMVADDSGGRGVLVDEGGVIWICDMGAWDMECREPLASSLVQWVALDCPLPSWDDEDDE